MEGKAPGDSGMVDELLEVNGLRYNPPIDLSVVVQRSDRTSHFQQNEYVVDEAKGKTVSRVFINNGKHFVLPRTSYLAFDVELPNPAALSATWGIRDSALNFIDRITLTSNSGVEIESQENFNILSYVTLAAGYSLDWRTTNGTLLRPAASETPLPRTGLGDQPVRYAIPLYLLSSLFDTDKMLPPQLMHGLRMDIQWADQSTVAQFSGGVYVASDNAYRVRNIGIVTDSCTLNPTVSQRIATVAATKGIELDFHPWHVTYQEVQDIGTGIGEDRIDLTGNRPVHRAECAFVHIGKEVDTSQNLVNSLSTVPWSWASFQWRVGSLFYPQSVTDRPSAQSGRFALTEVLKTFGKTRFNNDVGSVSYSDFTESTSDPVAIIAHTFERNERLHNTGTPLNETNPVQIAVKWDQTQTTPLSGLYPARLFIRHLRTIRVFSDNVEISE
jgi:hypothetical protein